MIGQTTRLMLEQQASSPWQRLSEEGRERLRLDTLDEALGSIEQLLLDDIPRVPRLLEQRIRHIVGTVDTRLGYAVDQWGSTPRRMQEIIYTAQGVVMKRLRE